MNPQQITEFTKNGYDVDSVTLTNQGRNLDEKKRENELFESWVREKEAEGYVKQGPVINIDSFTKTQWMIKKKIVIQV